MKDVIVIVTDDQRADTLAVMPTVQSALVHEGITFTRMIAPTPVCEPSRATLLSGRLPSQHGVHWVSGPNGGAPAFVGADAQTIATTLRAAGMSTGMFGKYMNAYDAQGPPTVPNWYIPPGWDRWRALRTARYYDYDIVREDGVLQHYGATAADYSTDVIKNEAASWMITVPRAKGLFAWIAPFGSHQGAGFLPEPAPRHAGAFTGIAPYRPPNHNEADISDKPAWLQAYAPTAMDAETIGYVDDFRQKQLETLLAIDELVATVIAVQNARRRYNQTIIVFVGDNGLGWGEHRRVVVKGTPYEHDILVPMVVRTPTSTQRIEPALLSQVDLYPTILGVLGLAVPPGLAGQDFSTLFVAPGLGRVSATLEGYSGAAGGYTGTRTATSTMITYSTGEVESYDLFADPWQLNNLH